MNTERCEWICAPGGQTTRLTPESACYWQMSFSNRWKHL